MATKAIHLELVSNLTSKAIIAALKRFIARRVLIGHLYRDNGSSFVGANTELKAFFKSEEFLQQVHIKAGKTRLQWQFIPPNSPHFGALWEAGVKSSKYHWKRIVGKALLNFDEFSTAITQVEACWNSRPLIALSSELNDPRYLCTGHFLIGAILTSLPEPALAVQQRSACPESNEFNALISSCGKRWSADYLNNLQQSSKWRSQHPDLQPGTLVLIRVDNLTPIPWRPAIISETFPGSEEHVRIVTVKNTSGKFK
jgi:hypothetical protein